jgi:opacity protein-like surface antigen
MTCWPRCTCTSSPTILFACVIRVTCLSVGLVWCLMACPAAAHDAFSRSEPSPKEEIYGAFFLLGSLAPNRNLNVGGEEIPSTTVKSGAGGGIKAGVFPSFTNYVVGIQAEMFGLGHQISAPASTGPQATHAGRGTLLAWTTLVSLVVRYPGERVQPYVGLGIGWSSSLLVGADLSKGSMTQGGIARDTSFASQYFAGLRMNLTPRVFLFGEYKYLASRFTWSGHLEPSLDFRTHIVAIGAGLSF